jgi:hypothetical protein
VNERIKDLQKQCWNHQTWNLDVERFAEAIVLECIGLLPEDCQSKNGCHASWIIKQHFGVQP